MAPAFKIRLIEIVLFVVISLAFWPVVISIVREEVASAMELERAALMKFLAGVAETKPAAVADAVKQECFNNEQAGANHD
jgi:hypothetical protein